MKSIQIRNVPDEIHRTLRVRAVQNGQSLSAYLLRELRILAQQPTIAEVLSRAREIPSNLTTEEIVAAVRSGRDRE